MKTLKTIIAILALTFTFSIVKASDPNVNEKLTSNYTITTYINAVAYGNTSNFIKIVDNNAKFSLASGSKVISFSKDEMLESFKTIQNVQQNCKIDSKIVENSANLMVYKVELKYPTFIRTNYVTIANTITGWKITNVASTFN